MTQHEQIAELYRERKRILDEHLPPHLRNLQAELKKKPRKKSSQREDKTYAVVKNDLLFILSGGMRKDIWKGRNQTQGKSCVIFKKIWPFPRLKWDSRYITIRIRFKLLSALDAVASDMKVTRQKALESICQACLEEDAFVARRTLGIRRST